MSNGLIVNIKGIMAASSKAMGVRNGGEYEKVFTQKMTFCFEPPLCLPKATGLGAHYCACLAILLEKEIINVHYSWTYAGLD